MIREIKKNRELIRFDNFIDSLHPTEEYSDFTVYRCNHKIIYYINEYNKTIKVCEHHIRDRYKTELSERDILDHFKRKFTKFRIRIE